MTSYSEKLRDPRWQRKRLEVLERADFKCEDCGYGESTLHVHHGYYRRGAEPWEYDASTLHCLCEVCHASRHEIEGGLRVSLANLSSVDLSVVLDVVRRMRAPGSTSIELRRGAA